MIEPILGALRRIFKGYVWRDTRVQIIYWILHYAWEWHAVSDGEYEVTAFYLVGFWKKKVWLLDAFKQLSSNLLSYCLFCNVFFLIFILSLVFF